jgi:hypothetical protein
MIPVINRVFASEAEARAFVEAQTGETRSNDEHVTPPFVPDTPKPNIKPTLPNAWLAYGEKDWLEALKTELDKGETSLPAMRKMYALLEVTQADVEAWKPYLPK